MNIINTAKTFLLLTILTGILLAVGYFIGGYAGALFALVFSALINFVSYWYSDKIVLKMYRAQEITAADNPALHQTVNKLCDAAGVPKPPLYLVKTIAPNAFATGRNPSHAAIAVTTGLLEHLEPSEVEAVLAHEIGHIANRDTLVSTMAATIAGAVTWVAHMAIFAGGRDRNIAASLAMMILAPIAASLVRFAVSRSREFGADMFGATVSKKPLKLASALQKIEHLARRMPLDVNPATSHLFIINPLSATSLAELFSTHPSVEARVERLKRMAEKT